MKSVIGIGLIMLALICSGCVEEDVSESILIEYGKQVNTWNDDVTKLVSLIDKWNTANEMAMADEHFTAEEVNQLINIADEYIGEAEFVVSHLESFKTFIVDNEQELKNAGVDTYQDKKDIDDANIQIGQNIKERMIPNLEYAIEYVETSEQEDAMWETIEDLTKILAFV